MNTAITINLNGRAFQVDEQAYQQLQEYLRQSTEKLANDPDKSEIIADIEQALADKLAAYIGAGKNVISESEVKTVISEMGPVEEPSASSSSNAAGSTSTSNAGVKKLYRIREGSMFFGVCNGLAAYFGLSVVLVRILFASLAVSTHGVWIFIYFVMVWLIPNAETSAEQAAAFGAPFTAQEFVNRARAEYQKMGANGEWKQTADEWKQKMRQEKKRMRHEMRDWHHNHKYQYHQWSSPIASLLIAALTIVWVYGLAMLVNHAMIFGIAISAVTPIWVAILIWSLLYIVVSGIVRTSTRHGYVVDHKGNTYYHHHGGPLQGIAWIALILVIGWLVYHFFPGSHQTFMQAQQLWLQFWHKIQ